jgi:DNA-binding response OmpR family regulator
MLSNSNQATILVVEDERAVARGLIYGLREEGFTVEWAAFTQLDRLGSALA